MQTNVSPGETDGPDRRSRPGDTWFPRISRPVATALSLVVNLALAVAIFWALAGGAPIAGWVWWSLFGLVMLVVVGVTVGVVFAIFARMPGGPGSWSAAGVAGRLVTRQRVLTANGAGSLRAEIHMAAGKLQVSGGSGQVMEGTFTYDDADWSEPDVQYEIDGSREGHLVVRQQATHRPAMRQGPAEWTVRLNDNVPTDLSVHLGAGQVDLKLAGISLTGLHVQGGVGALTIDLGGDWQRNLRAYVKGGIGSVSLRLPARTGVRVETYAGMGSVQPGMLTRDGNAYVNAAYGRSPVTLDITVEGGMSEIKLEQLPKVEAIA
jgi:hypothetical protein